VRNESADRSATVEKSEIEARLMDSTYLEEVGALLGIACKCYR